MSKKVCGALFVVLPPSGRRYSRLHNFHFIQNVKQIMQPTILGKANKPLVRLTLYTKKKPNRKPGRLKGKLKISQDFDAFDRKLQNLFGVK